MIVGADQEGGTESTMTHVLIKTNQFTVAGQFYLVDAEVGHPEDNRAGHELRPGALRGRRAER